MNIPIMAIDPGASGGIAVLTPGNPVVCIKMPSTPMDILDTFRALVERNPGLKCIIERVGGGMPGNSAHNFTTLARHMGHLDMALLAVAIPTEMVMPAKWMRGIGIPAKMDKTARKNAIKAAMQRRYPAAKVTLWNADALGILTWYIGVEK